MWVEQRYEGLDHLMVIGRATWDFRRKLNADWGNVLLEIPSIKKVGGGLGLGMEELPRRLLGPKQGQYDFFQSNLETHHF